jgi:hypothetical protein
MSSLLSRSAISCLKGSEAEEILQAYMDTGPDLVFSHEPSAMQKQPSGTGAGDKLIKPS